MKLDFLAFLCKYRFSNLQSTWLIQNSWEYAFVCTLNPPLLSPPETSLKLKLLRHIPCNDYYEFQLQHFNFSFHGFLNFFHFLASFIPSFFSTFQFVISFCFLFKCYLLPFFFLFLRQKLLNTFLQQSLLPIQITSRLEFLPKICIRSVHSTFDWNVAHSSAFYNNRTICAIWIGSSSIACVKMK